MLKQIFMLTVSILGADILKDVINGLLIGSKSVKSAISKYRLSKDESEREELDKSRTITGFK